MKNKSTRDDLQNHICGVNCSENVPASKVIKSRVLSQSTHYFLTRERMYLDGDDF